ncbi:MAG TPA: CDP-glycerol glycerophosphotransferase family protein [Micromonosporaceae bacterium]
MLPQKFAKLFLNAVLPTLLAAVALVVFAMTPRTWVGALLVAGVLVAGFAASRTGARIRHVRSSRPLLAAAAMVGFGRTAVPEGAGTDLALVIAAVAFIVVVTTQSVLATLMPDRTLAANLAGQVRRHVFTPTRMDMVNLGVVVVLTVGALTSFPSWVADALAAVAAAFFLGVCAAGLRVRIRGDEDWAIVKDAVKRHHPRFMIYFSAPPETEYHVSMWLPYLERVGRPFLIVVREAHSLPVLAAATKSPVVVCETADRVEDMVVPSLKAIFYVNNAPKNIQVIRFREQTHVQLLHGDSDKPSSYNPVTAVFDKIFVAGQAGIDRYAKNGIDIPAQKFTIVGRPQVEAIQVAPAGPIGERKVVLYAPTWKGVYTDMDHCSLRVAAPIFDRLLQRGATIIFRPHPYAERDRESAAHKWALDRMLAQDAARTGRRHIWGQAATKDMSFFDCANASDAMVSDVSSVASDYLFSEKPFAIVNMGSSTEEEFTEGFPLGAAAHVLRADLKNLDEVLDDLLDADPKRDERLKQKTYYLGPFPAEEYADAFVEEARRLT